MTALCLTRCSQSTWRRCLRQCPLQRQRTGNDRLRPYSCRDCVCWSRSRDGIVFDSCSHGDRRQRRVDSVGRENRKSICRSRQHRSDGRVNSDARSRSDSRNIGAAFGNLAGGSGTSRAVSLETTYGCFGVNDANVATLPIQTPWQGNKSWLECCPRIWVGWSRRDSAGRRDSLCDNSLGVSPSGPGVPDGLTLGSCDFRWNYGDIVGLSGLGDGQGVVHR
jgi:hypothetical protein